MRAYSEAYLSDVVENQGKLFDFVAHTFPENDTEDFINTYMKSKTRKSIDDSMAYVNTMDAKELWNYFIDTEKYHLKKGKALGGFMPDWIGEFYAYYQWYYNLEFEQITDKVTITSILLMYQKYHEMDIRQFVYGLDEMRACHHKRQVARLQEYRKRISFSQKELAEKADVPLRTIQQYEQKQKNINHARADYVIRLAKALYCRPEDLLELETLQ